MNLLIVTALLAGVVAGWYWLHRKLKGADSPLSRLREPGKDRADAAAEMEAFIAAYRAGRIDPSELKSAGTSATAPTASGNSGDHLPVPSLPVNGIPEPAPIAPAALSPVISPEVKLGYLTFRAGLPDHHVFPNLWLADLRVSGDGKIDLLICNAEFKPVAAVDIVGLTANPDAGKTAALHAVGIRYLALAASRLPRPADVRGLLYPAQ
jgi:hypothetical protein